MLVLMLIYHTAYSLVALFGVRVSWFWNWPGIVMQLVIACTFNFVAGICTQLGKNSLRHGLTVLGSGLLITLVTWIAMPEQLILFGVLHLLGLAMVAEHLLRPLLRRIPWRAGMTAGVLLFVLCYRVPWGRFGIGPLSVSLPASLYGTSHLWWLGFPGAGFSSADYFPVIPWLFLFLGGSFLGRRLTEGNLPDGWYKSRVPLLAALGRNTLPVYLIHQPVIIGVLWVWFWLFP